MHNLPYATYMHKGSNLPLKHEAAPRQCRAVYLAFTCLLATRTHLQEGCLNEHRSLVMGEYIPKVQVIVSSQH